MTFSAQSPTEAELRTRWNRLVRWVACAMAANLVCGFLVATAATRSTPAYFKPSAQREIETPRPKTGGACRAVSGERIRSL